MTWTPTIITIKDATGTDVPVIAYTDGTNLAFARPVLDTAGAIISPATSGKQDTGNTSLAAIATNTTGVATATNQSTGNTFLGHIDTNLGAQADGAASSDTGAFSLISLFKRGLQALASIATYLAPVSGVIPMTVDVTATAGRTFAAKITTAGNVSITFSDATTGIYPVSIGLNTFPFGVTKVNSSGTTATGTYENWK